MEIPLRILNNLRVEEENNDIKEAIRILYDCEHKEIAKQICNRFAKAGSNFLRPLYKEFQLTEN